MVNVDVASELHRTIHSDAPEVIATAPGRVNLIGEHTDYNDGFVFPMAIPFGTTMAVSNRDDRRVCAHSERFGLAEFDLDADPRTTDGWGRYLHGMAWVLAEHGIDIGGFDAAVVSDIPGSSLSSSAALEMAAGTALAALAGSELDAPTLARLGQRVEHEVIGVPVGIMDQLISAAGIAGAASLIDCRSLETRPTPLPDTARVVVLDTGTRRGLVDSEYAARRAACERAAGRAGCGGVARRDARRSRSDRARPDRPTSSTPCDLGEPAHRRRGGRRRARATSSSWVR